MNIGLLMLSVLYSGFIFLIKFAKIDKTQIIFRNLMSHTNHYETLGVSQTAPSEVIVAAQIALRQKYNPDNFQELNDKAQALATLQKIDEACAVLLNTEARKKYDNYLAYLSDEKYLNNKPSPPPTSQKNTNHTDMDWDLTGLDNIKKTNAKTTTTYSTLNREDELVGLNDKKQKPKSKTAQVIGILVAIFLLWLIYAIASVGYDFYRMSKQGSDVNPAETITVNDLQVDNNKGLIEIENKKANEFTQKNAQLSHRLEAKQRQFNALWENASDNAKAALLDEQKDWELRTKTECQTMAKGESSSEREFNELQCKVVKLEARQIQVERFFAEFKQQEDLAMQAALEAEALAQAELQSQTQTQPNSVEQLPNNNSIQDTNPNQ